jgi:hypothetical protein
VLAAGTGPASLVARLAWLRPRRPRSRGDQVAWALREATTLGLVALGGMPAYARALLAGDDPRRSSRPCSRSRWTTCSSRRT